MKIFVFVSHQTKHLRSNKTETSYVFHLNLKKHRTKFQLTARNREDFAVRHLAPRREPLFAQLRLQPLSRRPAAVLQPRRC